MNTKIALMFCSFLASVICLLAVAQSNQPKGAGEKQWPKQGEPKPAHDAAVKNAVDSFTAALTRAGHDREFRNRLTSSCDSAKQAVSEEGNIAIPENVVTMFYEHGTYKDHFGFFLPPFKPEVRPRYKYAVKEYYKCCFPMAKTFALTTIDPSLAAALDAAMTRAGYDPEFRDRLSASCDSAKQAVSEEGHVQIKKEVQMMFQDMDRGDKGDDRYHIFQLPPFDPNSSSEHAYEDYFVGLYPSWGRRPDEPTPMPKE
jgi:hypothetical protein